MIAGCYPDGWSDFGLPSMPSLLPFDRGGITRSRIWSSTIRSGSRCGSPNAFNAVASTEAKRLQSQTPRTRSGQAIDF